MLTGKDLFKAVIEKVISEPERWDQRFYNRSKLSKYKDQPFNHGLGAAHCIAGWYIVLHYNLEQIPTNDFPSKVLTETSHDLAIKLLEFQLCSPEQVKQINEMFSSHSGFQQILHCAVGLKLLTREEAEAYLKQFNTYERY